MSGLSAFSGSFNTTRLESHTFQSEDFILISMALTSFTKNTCWEIYDKLLPSLEVAFPQIPRIKYNGNTYPPFAKDSTFLDLGNYNSEEDGYRIDVYYNKFDTVTKTYTKVDFRDKYAAQGAGGLILARIYQLIIAHEAAQRNDPNYVPIKDLHDEIRDIQNSSTGCLKIYFPKRYLLQEGEDYEDDRQMLIKLYFQKFQKRNQDRVMTVKGAPLITDVPSTEAGTSVRHQETKEFQEDPTNTGSIIPATDEGIDDSRNIVTGKLGVYWNKTEKQFESGTRQTLAKLLTDIDAAPITNIVPPQNMGGLSNFDFYDPESSLYMGGFSTGLAMVLSIENGNPHLFGPNIIECGDKKFEKVRAVNRSAKSYKAGEVVMLSKMHGEWIISSLGEATAQDVSAKVGEWSFAKYIVNSDSFFKDGRYYQTGGANNQVNKNILPKEYEKIARNAFYTNQWYLNNIVSGLNFPLSTYNKPTFTANERQYIETSQRYLISSTFDQLPPYQGGFLNPNITRKGLGGPVINIINPTDPYITEMSQGMVVFPFWGPVFTDGYKSRKNKFFDKDLLTGNESKYFNGVDDIGAPVSIDDMDKKNVPAEITSRIIDSIYTFNSPNLLSSNLANLCRTKFCYPPFYESEPVSKSKVSFMPLYDTLVGSTDVWSILAKIPDRNYFKYVYDTVFNIPFNQSLFGSIFFNRLPYDNIYNDPTVKNSCLSDYDASLIAGGFINDEFINSVVTGVGGLKNVPSIPYDCYIKQQPTNIPLGTPRYYRTTPAGAECVGITVGMTTLRKVGGGEINFQTSQYFGLGQKKTATSQEGAITILPIGPGIGWGFGGGVSERAEKQWGSSSDSIDSFGTTALHCRIFDYWPEEQTFFDPRYFAVLHFNPYGLGTEPVDGYSGDPFHISAQNPLSTNKNKAEYFGIGSKYESKGLTAEQIDDKYRSIASPENIYLRYQGDDPSFYSGKTYMPYSERPRSVDVEETSVDIRIPTFDEAVIEYKDGEYSKIPSDKRTLANYSYGSNGLAVPPGYVITSKTPLRPVTEWRNNVIRRGQLLSGDDDRGFIYKYTTIGLNENDYSFFKRGTKFSVNEEIDLDHGVTLTVMSVNNEGGIDSFALAKKTDVATILNLNYAVIIGDQVVVIVDAEQKSGTGFLPSDFTAQSQVRTELVWTEDAKKCYRLTVPSSGENGENAIIEFYSGVVWEAFGQDKPPKEYGGMPRLTLSSNRGESASEGVQDTSVPIDANDTGFYNAFFFFHNDITHTVPNDRPFMGGFLQYVNLTIT